MEIVDAIYDGFLFGLSTLSCFATVFVGLVIFGMIKNLYEWYAE